MEGLSKVRCRCSEPKRKGLSCFFRLPELIIILIFLLPFVANILGVSELIRIAKAKGHYTDGAGLLWFIGLCGTALMLGLIVCALPDRGIPATRTSYTRNDDTLPEV